MAILEWKGQYGGPDQPGAVVATDQKSWVRAWRQLGREAPSVDFSRFVGVMVFVGRKMTGGWTPIFADPVSNGDDAIVRYRVPEPVGLTTQAIAQPWKARIFQRPKGRLIVEPAPK